MIYTYMGVLKPRMGNANFCSAGQLSPLLNDPLYKTIGIGTKIFLGVVSDMLPGMARSITPRPRARKKASPLEAQARWLSSAT